MKPIVTSVSLLTLCASPALAQDAFDLGEITVFSTLSGEETALDRTGGAVEVVTERDLQRAPETDVAGYLSQLPGVTSSANGGVGSSATLQVRGLGGRYIKVLIDGIDVTDPAAPQTLFNWGQLTSSNITRLELLKGSSSSLFGSRAIGGVVNIATGDTLDEPGTAVQLRGEGGSFNTYRFDGRITAQSERGGISAAIGYLRTDGFSATDGDENTETDGYEGTQVNVTGDYQATELVRLGFSAFALDSNGEFDEFGGDGTPPFDEVNSTESRALRGFAEIQTGGVQHTVSASGFRNDRVSSTNGVDSSFLGERQRVDYVGVFSATPTTVVTYGADWEREEFTTNTDSGADEQTGVFAEAVAAPTDALDLAGSLRWDQYSSFGGNLSGRLAAAYRVTDTTILRAVAATGFRAPSLYELNSTEYGNPDLEPEQSLSFELGAEQRFGPDSFVRATAFYTRIDDLIQFVQFTGFPDPFTGQYQQVAGTSRTQGIELSSQYGVTDGVQLFANYTFTDTRDANGAPFARVPAHDFVLGALAETENGWNAAVTLRHVADRPDEFGTPMPDYSVVNASVGYQLTEVAELYLRIENLFNEDYQTAAGFQAAPRAFYAGLRATF
jgi:vitamin B12 transporter